MMIAEGKRASRSTSIKSLLFQSFLQLEHKQLGSVQEILAQETSTYIHHELSCE